jgi:thiol-disulfide isomerase/thioredoxin
MTSNPDPQWRSWLPLVLLPLIGIGAAVLVILASNADSGGDSGSSAASFPSPPPVTFIPPTPLPAATFTPTVETVIDRPVPDLVLPTLDGGTIRLSDLRGQIVFLNFWATWCAPCREEMPALQQLQDEQGDAVRVIAITNPDDGQTEDDVRAFLDEFDLTLTVALPTDFEPHTRFNVWQLPTTYIVDRAGIVRYRHIGALEPDDIATYLDWLADS